MQFLFRLLSGFARRRLETGGGLLIIEACAMFLCKKLEDSGVGVGSVGLRAVHGRSTVRIRHSSTVYRAKTRWQRHKKSA